MRRRCWLLVPRKPASAMQRRGQGGIGNRQPGLFFRNLSRNMHFSGPVMGSVRSFMLLRRSTCRYLPELDSVYTDFPTVKVLTRVANVRPWKAAISSSANNKRRVMLAHVHTRHPHEVDDSTGYSPLTDTAREPSPPATAAAPYAEPPTISLLSVSCEAANPIGTNATP